MKMTTSSGLNANWRSGRRPLGLALGLCLAAASAQAWPAGKGHGVEVLLVSPQLIEAQPGHVLSLSLRVTNTTEAAEELTEALALPPGWQAITPLGILTLGPHETQVRLIALPVPRGAAAGQYPIAYSVRGKRDYAIEDEGSATVVVPSVGQLSLLIETKPDFVIAGEDYQVTVRVINRGNAEAHPQLQVRSEEGYPATIDPAQATLAPGASQVVSIRVKTNKQEKRPRQNVLQIRAVEPDGQAPPASLAVCVDVVPRVTRPVDPERRLPASLTVRTVGDGDHIGAQVEFSGSGPLDDTGSQQLAFLFRGPDTQSCGLFGLRDEYWVDYASPRFDVALGDRTYGLSTLTDSARYGRGLSLDVRPDGRGGHAPEIGAYYLHSRWETPGLSKGGAHVSYDFDSHVGLRLNFLAADHRAIEGLPSPAQRVWSAEATVRPTRNSTMAIECAGSHAEAPKGSADTAYRLTADTKVGPNGHISLSKTHAGPDFAGYYSDSDYTNIALAFPFTRRLTARAFLGRWAQNLDRRPERLTAPRESVYGTGIDYALSRRWYLAADYDRFAHHDLVAPPDRNYAEQSLKLSVGYSSRRASYRCELRTGDQSAPPTGQHVAVAGCGLVATYRPSDALAASLSGNLGNGRSAPYSRLLDESNSLGVSLDWKPSSACHLTASYLRYDHPLLGADSQQINVRATYAMRSGARWELGAFRGEPLARSGSAISYMLSYAIPIGVPLGKRTDVGRIRGRIYDAQQPDRRGLANVLLRVSGAVAVTDANGRFSFPALTPGKYSVSVDRRSIGLTRITEERLPLLVEVRGGAVQEVSIGVVPAASVSGSVVVMARPDTSTSPAGIESAGSHTLRDATGTYIVGDPEQRESSAEPQGLPNVLVELTDGREVRRAVTDSRGGFIFDSLRPGDWHLMTYDANLPEYHFVDNAEMDFQLVGGQQETVTVKVLPKLRRIRMVDLGTASVAERTSPVPPER